jgi:hypothetical protein
VHRLLRFLKEWGLLVAVGDTWVDSVVRWLGYVAVVVIVAGFPASQQQAWFYVEIKPGWDLRWPTSPERLILVILTVAYALVTIGAPWVRSSGPVLMVAALLEEDPETRVFRLRVGINGAGAAQPIANVESIVDDAGQPILTAQMPVELQWSNHPVGVRPELSRHVPATVGIVTALHLPIVWVAGGPHVPATPMGLRLHGMYHSPQVDTLTNGGNRRVALKVAVSIPGAFKAETRWFGFTPEPDVPMLFTATTLNVNRQGRPVWPARP